jgi:hypothetical protein
VASFANHCGNCHYAFGGGGPRNPYGQDLETALADFPNNPNGRRQAVVSIENLDCDTDGYNTLVEVTDTVTFGNTPTFAGLTPANIGQVSGVDVTEIQLYLVPSTGQDLTPPEVTVTSPNGGELLTGNNSAMATWTATDASGIAAIDLYLSLDNGATFKPVAIGLSNTGSHTWFPANRPTSQAIFKVVATDNAFNQGEADSDGTFTIQSGSSRARCAISTSREPSPSSRAF